MKHYATPPGFDPSIMIDVDALRKELLEDAEAEQSMLLEEGEEDNAMKTE